MTQVQKPPYAPSSVMTHVSTVPAEDHLKHPHEAYNWVPNDTAYRCNIITEENNAIADYSAGHITTEEATELIASIKKASINQAKSNSTPA